MSKLPAILAAALTVSACSQITTNDSERSDLKAAADEVGDVYIECVVNYAVQNASSATIDSSTATKLGAKKCTSDLDRFKKVQLDYLSSQYMMTDKPLQESIDALNERAAISVGETLMAAGGGAVAGTAVVVATDSSDEDWSDAQQDYLDCMAEQAGKYSGLDESAGVIADVAQNRCKASMTGPNAAALEQEGRATAMGVVLDAKLDSSDPSQND